MFRIIPVQNMFTFVHVHKVAHHTANSELRSKFRPYVCSSMVVVKLMKHTLATMEHVHSFVIKILWLFLILNHMHAVQNLLHNICEFHSNNTVESFPKAAMWFHSFALYSVCVVYYSSIAICSWWATLIHSFTHTNFRRWWLLSLCILQNILFPVRL